MLVFVSDYPNSDNIRDGMMQRVAAIDSLAEDRKRIYLSISFRNNKKRKTVVHTNCTIEYLNFFLHQKIIKSIINSASVVYVHSLYNFIRIYFAFCGCKTILDIHGVVPEEMEMMGGKWLPPYFHKFERKAILESKVIIHVTNSMLEHYNEKYKTNLSKKSLVLPIFEQKTVSYNSSKWDLPQLKIVYAGGVQVWQNIDLMVDVIKKIGMDLSLANKVSFYILLPESQVGSFSAKYVDVSCMSNVSIFSLPKERVLSFLSDCHMGFVLRDPMVVNHVACPTKLVEYLECGVIPIVKSRQIGDFEQHGYQCIDYDEINEYFDLKKLEHMAKINGEVLAKLKMQGLLSKDSLKNYLK
ncbi:hypothetical protein ACK33Z_17415 [Aeromonas veronii]